MQRLTSVSSILTRLRAVLHSRDVSIHAASAEAKHVDNVVGLLSDVVLRPLFTEDEVSELPWHRVTP